MTDAPGPAVHAAPVAGVARAAQADAPVFIVGIARSGTTLLAAMLSAHSRLDCGPESRFFARYRHLDSAARARLLDPALWPDPAVEFVGSLRNQGHPVNELFGLTLVQVRDHLAGRPPSLAAMLESLTVSHARAAGKARWMEKTPRHLLMTDTLWRHWPAARVIRIVRDPRDVALSLSRMPFAKDSVVGNLVRVDHDDRISRQRVEADPRAMTLRYEDLVTEPERELRRICRFLGEDYEPGMLDARGTAAKVAAAHEWWKEGVSGPLNSSSVGRWRREMSADLQRFAGLHLAAYLRRHGYEGAATAAGEVAILPGGAAVGPSNEDLLLQLARRGLVVARPVPRAARALRRQRHLVFLGVKGQLDPARGSTAARRVGSIATLAGGLLIRRLRGRPVPWVRQATLLERRSHDPSERLLVLLLRLFARDVALAEVPALVAAMDRQGAGADDPALHGRPDSG